MKKYNNALNLKILSALNFFIKNPNEEIHLREFSRKLKISPNTSQRFIEILLNEGLIVEQRKANLRYVQANKDNFVFRYIKKAFSLRAIRDSEIIDYLKEKGFAFVILFGSMARGEDDSRSDIDLVCIGSKKEDLSKFSLRLGREINAHFFSWAEWKKQTKDNRGFYMDVITQGINLLGEKPIAD